MILEPHLVGFRFDLLSEIFHTFRDSLTEEFYKLFELRTLTVEHLFNILVSI